LENLTFKEVQLEPKKSIDELKIEAIELNFKNGMRSTKLEGQPASWVVKALQVLEAGQELTVEMVKQFDMNQ